MGGGPAWHRGAGGRSTQCTHSCSERYSLLRSVTCSRLSLRVCKVTSGPLTSSMTNLPERFGWCWCGRVRPLWFCSVCVSGSAGIRADPRKSGSSFGTTPALIPSPDEEPASKPSNLAESLPFFGPQHHPLQNGGNTVEGLCTLSLPKFKYKHPAKGKQAGKSQRKQDGW